MASRLRLRSPRWQARLLGRLRLPGPPGRAPRCWASESGQTLVELAIGLSVLMLLVLGGIEVGRVANAWAIVTHASREGAREASVRCTLDPGCATTVQSSINNALTGLDVVAARWSITPGPYVSGAPVTVHVQYQVQLVTPLLDAIVPGRAITVTGQTGMRLE